MSFTRKFSRCYSTAKFLTSERYPDIKRGPFGILTDKHVSQFENLLGSNRVITSEDELESYNVDWIKNVRGNSKIVLRPKTVGEVVEIMKICSRDRLAVCPQGGNTGLVGGSVPVFDEVILSTSLMNKIHEIDEVAGTISCDAGCVLEKLDSALEEKGFMMPLDLGAKGSCQIGGNISTCAGGLRLLRYGSLQATTLGLEAVLADGRVIDVMNKLKKDNTGYHLRQLFIGSEGTLGIVTKAVIQCPVRPSSVHLAFFALRNYNDVLSTVSLARKRLSEILSSCEIMDAESMKSVTTELGLKCPVEPQPFYMVIETHGSSEDHDFQKLNAFLDEAMDLALINDGITTSTPSTMHDIWQLRERITESLCKQRFIYKYDITLPLQKFYEAVLVMRKRLEKYGNEVTVSGFGHLGDGNLHLNVQSDEFRREINDDIEPFLFEWTKQQNGSISAEHGIGFKKTKYLKYSKSEEAIQIMKSIKNSLDPLGILNPYKVLPLK